MPVIEDRHRAQMIMDLYACRWSYWLIAQALGVRPETARDVIIMNGRVPPDGLGSDR